MKKAFAIFSPMVGTIVILIAILIVSSIISSEKINMQGTLYSYKASQMGSVATEAQTLITEEIRNEILSELALPGIMSVKVANCPSKELVEDGVIRGAVSSKDREYTCWNNTFNQVYWRSYNQLVGVRLLSTSIGNTIKHLLSKYELVKIEYNDAADLSQVTGEIEFLSCEWGKPGNCKDGRMKVYLDFTEVADTPIATVSSANKQLNIFMPNIEKEYITAEPYGMYAVYLSDMFQEFQLLNNSWHLAGYPQDFRGSVWHGSGKDDYSITKGDEWYHYNYVVHNRYTGGEGQNLYADDFNPGFWFSQNSPLADHFEGRETLWDYLSNPNGKSSVLRTSNQRGSLSYSYASGGIEQTQTKRKQLQLRWDYVKKYYDELLDVVSGNLAESQALGVPFEPITSSSIYGSGSFSNPDSEYYRMDQPLPQGCVDGSGSSCSKEGAGDTTCAAELGIEPAIIEPMLDTSENYDKKFSTGNSYDRETVEYKFDELVDTIRKSALLKSSMGYGTETPHFKLTVESKQYYANGFTFGGDNFHCGQFLTTYIPGGLGVGCDMLAENDKYAKCMENPNPVTYDACSYFVSSPIPFECRTETLYRVDEKYRLRRNTHNAPQDVDRTVFVVTYQRMKNDYDEWGDETGTQLWDGTIDVTNSTDTETTRVRHCIYTFDTSKRAPDDYTTECEWVQAEDVEDFVVGWSD